ncbi:hypothetical protein LY90DRAFT_503945 [Neocallimastix californiae]|uniref:Uncharacterized protein n=1 Tax=Neocallimastix californiae TaxID=1754190 RepID=A0A1Y2EGZ2_9FUNG|nr:hypothetical protein LY90DRAFT_503945 [Neocallimastix californiae]|eukprot:ORY70840.1 hypothetical protein LY90DRAFT_503945 [Neocallimastix californiae]
MNYHVILFLILHFVDWLTSLYSTSESERNKEIKEKINKNRWYYLKNQKSDIITLKKSVFMKYRNDKKFSGYRFKADFENAEYELLVIQYVNEKEELKKIGKILFYRESYLELRNHEKNRNLFRKYIGGNERDFLTENKDSELL